MPIEQPKITISEIYNLLQNKGYTIRIDKECDSYTAIACCRLWVDKEVKIFQYSLEWSSSR